MKDHHIKDRRQFHLFFQQSIQIPKYVKLIGALFSLLLLILPINFWGQTVEPDKSPKGTKTLVKVPIIVTDREGRRITGLKKEDFALFQAEQRQNITSFASENEPISIALLIDTSGSTQSSLDKIKEAAADFIDVLNEADQCLIATFDSKVNVLNPLTSDRKTLKNSLNKIQTADSEGTVMFNAVNQMVKTSFTDVRGRKAIVLLSDGKDYGSTVTKTELLNELQESDLSIYAIFYQSGIGFNQPVISSTGTVVEGKENKKPEPVKKPKVKKKGYTILIPLPGETFTQEEIKLIDKTMTTDAVNSLKEMTDLTAGRLYTSDTEKLGAVFKQVAGELRQVYLLGFEGTSDALGENVTVKVGRPGVVVNTRKKLLLNSPKN
jgi:VWFA-related protein